jgi:hypothetical protein
VDVVLIDVVHVVVALTEVVVVRLVVADIDVVDVLLIDVVPVVVELTEVVVVRDVVADIEVVVVTLPAITVSKGC